MRTRGRFLRRVEAATMEVSRTSRRAGGPAATCWSRTTRCGPRPTTTRCSAAPPSSRSTVVHRTPMTDPRLHRIGDTVMRSSSTRSTTAAPTAVCPRRRGGEGLGGARTPGCGLAHDASQGHECRHAEEVVRRARYRHAVRRQPSTGSPARRTRRRGQRLETTHAMVSSNGRARPVARAVSIVSGASAVWIAARVQV